MLYVFTLTAPVSYLICLCWTLRTNGWNSAPPYLCAWSGWVFQLKEHLVSILKQQ